MYKAIVITLLTTVIGGCSGLGDLLQTPDESFYAIDRENKFYCRGSSSHCLDMTKIVSARSMLSPIEEAYQQKIEGPNYPVNLIQVLLNPTDGAYQGQPVGREGRFFQIPKTARTDMVWNTLSEIVNQHTGSPGS